MSQPGGDPSPGGGGGGGGGGAEGACLDDNAYDHATRLHSFLVSALTSLGGGGGRSQSRRGGNRRSPDGRAGDGGDRGQAEAKAGARTVGSRTIESLRCLVSVRRGAVGGDVSASVPAPAPAVVHPRLREGRNVLTLVHSSFLSDLGRYELRGEDPPPEYTQRRSFGAFLYHRPDQALTALGCAVGLSLSTLWRRARPNLGILPAPERRSLLDQIGRFLDGARYVVRFTDVYPQLRMVDVKTQMAYRFVSIRGHVTKARPKHLRVVSADFQCGKCGCHVPHRFWDGRYSAPERCSTVKCRSKTFNLVRSTARYIDHQELRLQESQDETTVDAGRTPRQMVVEVGHDLVDGCNAGDVVQVSGIIRAVNSAVAAGKTGKRALENSTYKLFMTAHSIANMTADSREDGAGGGRQSKRARTGASNGGGGGDQSFSAGISFTDEQCERIVRLAHADHRIGPLSARMAFPFDLLVRSLCPSIIGHDLVKAGMLLGLLGGTPPLSSDMEARSSGMSIRYNSHILVVGDPGMGKSQMLLAASQIATRSVYVGGNTASTTGLTVSLTKEAGGEVGIEAGALVLADQGVCCIDEFDKMAKSHQDGERPGASFERRGLETYIHLSFFLLSFFYRFLSFSSLFRTPRGNGAAADIHCEGWCGRLHPRPLLYYCRRQSQARKLQHGQDGRREPQHGHSHPVEVRPRVHTKGQGRRGAGSPSLEQHNGPVPQGRRGGRIPRGRAGGRVRKRRSLRSGVRRRGLRKQHGGRRGRRAQEEAANTAGPASALGGRDAETAPAGGPGEGLHIVRTGALPPQADPGGRRCPQGLFHAAQVRDLERGLDTPNRFFSPPPPPPSDERILASIATVPSRRCRRLFLTPSFKFLQRYPQNEFGSRSDTVPITTRQLEALIRLSQARAKACLREFVVEEDAHDVVELMEQSVNQVHMDEEGKMDRTRGGAAGTSNRQSKRMFEEEVKKIAAEKGDLFLDRDDMLKAAHRADCGVSAPVADMIDHLREKGVIMKQGDCYKLCR